MGSASGLGPPSRECRVLLEKKDKVGRRNLNQSRIKDSLVVDLLVELLPAANVYLAERRQRRLKLAELLERDRRGK